MENNNQRPNSIPCPNCGGRANFSHVDDAKHAFYKCEQCSNWILLPDKPPSTRSATSKLVTIRVNSDEWDRMKEIAYSMGFTRNGLINMFIKSIIVGEAKIERKDNITYVDINLVPITNQNINVNASQTKIMKNQLIIDEIKREIASIYDTPIYKEKGKIPYQMRERLKKLLLKAQEIPPELFEEARKLLNVSEPQL